MNPALNNFYYNILTTYTDKITKIFWVTEQNSANTKILKITMGEITIFHNIARPTSNT